MFIKRLHSTNSATDKPADDSERPRILPLYFICFYRTHSLYHVAENSKTKCLVISSMKFGSFR